MSGQHQEEAPVKERYFFDTPLDEEEFLWCVPVLHAYILERIARGFLYELTIVVNVAAGRFPERVALLQDYLGADITVVASCDVDCTILDEYDFVFFFNIARARAVGFPGLKHITESLGICLGSRTFSQLPILAAGQEENLVLCVTGLGGAFENAGKLADMINAEIPDWRATVLDWGSAFPSSFPPPRSVLYQQLSTASLVIGPRGLHTLIAASMGKTVFEIHDSSIEPEQWRAKVSGSNKVFQGQASAFPAEFLLGFVKKFVEKRRGYYGPPTTGQLSTDVQT